MAPKRLSELGVKRSCKVVKLTGRKAIKKGLLELGFIQGTEIYVEKFAPLRDPMDLVHKGYHLSLRQDETHDFYIEKHHKEGSICHHLLY